MSKKLPVKVNHYKAATDKWTSSVGPLRFKITSVEYQKMKKSEANKPDNSGIDEAYKELNNHYYQVKVNYLVKNSSKKAVNPQYTIWVPEDESFRQKRQVLMVVLSILLLVQKQLIQAIAVAEVSQYYLITNLLLSTLNLVLKKFLEMKATILLKVE